MSAIVDIFPDNVNSKIERIVQHHSSYLILYSINKYIGAAIREVNEQLMIAAWSVSGRRDAERSERSEDGTPAARDPPEGCRGPRS
jgi:hypothetical protein